MDNEDVWVNYEMEEAEVEIDLADMTLEHLVIESIKALIDIEGNKRTSELSSHGLCIV